MKRTLLLFTLALSTIASFAQQPDSLLKQFKYRINTYRAIGLGGNAGSNFSQVDYPIGKRTNNGASGALSGNYYTTNSTDKILNTASAGLNGSYSRLKFSDQASKTNSRFFSSTVYVNVLNQWFRKKMFTELGTSMSGIFYSGKDINSGIAVPDKNNVGQYAIAVNMGIGTGRLENVTDMQNALWLYRELLKIDRLRASLSADELMELGKSITKGNNTRVLDARKRTQFLLTTVDNYLQQKGIINKTDITYFSNLNDILFFAFNNARLSGTEKFIRLTPGITGWNSDQVQTNGTDKQTHDFNTRSVVLSSGIKKYVPVNLVHQNNYGASLRLSYFSSDLHDRYLTNGVISSDVKGSTKIKQAGANLFFEHAIYPNTRTNINFNLQTEFGYQDIDKDFYATASTSVFISYFISYRTRLTCNAGANYQKNKYSFNRYVELLPNSVQLLLGAGIEISL